MLYLKKYVVVYVSFKYTNLLQPLNITIMKSLKGSIRN